ncbi:uncharacterized protein PSFLO_05977 [Pseudozyma flocculosa]|uniref:Uncharacterized protein n=1 Tax=Pseudozyma flocculosa TaxID=84751 RepID=A0A5C3FA24_9BASI|nr:uncharacterized protein PSFLO_05977 [Pseudozyma flocculosa]
MSEWLQQCNVVHISTQALVTIGKLEGLSPHHAIWKHFGVLQSPHIKCFGITGSGSLLLLDAWGNGSQERPIVTVGNGSLEIIDRLRGLLGGHPIPSSAARGIPRPRGLNIGPDGAGGRISG